MVALQSVAGVVLLVVGGVLGAYALSHYRRYRIVADTPTTDLTTVEAGTVELNGTVSEVRETAAPTVHGHDTAAVEVWEVEEWDERGDGARWKTLALGVDGGEFVLETDDGEEVVVDVPTESSGSFSLPESVLSTGMAGVAVGDLAVEVERMPHVQVDPESGTPDRIRSFVHSHRDVDTQSGSITNLIDIGNAHGERRYHSQTIGEGDSVYVLGHAHLDPDATHPPRPEHVTVGADPDGDTPTIVSTLRENRLIAKGRTRSRVAGAVAALALLAGLALLWGPYLAGAGPA